jgi:hypothetical protein
MSNIILTSLIVGFITALLLNIVWGAAQVVGGRNTRSFISFRSFVSTGFIFSIIAGILIFAM